MRATPTGLDIQREPFNQPFAFKGSAFHDKWNAIVRLADDAGNEAYGVGGLAVLWSDEAVFTAHTEVGGNVVMLAVLERALQCIKDVDFSDPIVLQEAIFSEVHAFGRTVTGNERLRPTFTLNALVALDNAAWVLWARRQGAVRFDEIIPPESRAALSGRHEALAAVPLITYGQSEQQIRQVLAGGAGLIKVKIGQSGSEDEMLAKDMERLSLVHGVAASGETPMTASGRVLYYLDANGRYRRKESLQRLLEHARGLGMLERIAILEEPFAEECEHEVGDLPVRIAADESLHDPADVRRRCQQGYGAIALKPAGKTLSMAFRMAAAAARLNLPCFVADNACVPILVDWNKNIAARLAPFPGMRSGILESNGPQMYDAWPHLLATHPCAGAPWLHITAGQFLLNEDFYRRSGGIFLEPKPYAGLV